MKDEQQPAPAPQTALRKAVPVVDIKTITGNGREAVILHDGERYRLRITANGKLILTK